MSLIAYKNMVLSRRQMISQVLQYSTKLPEDKWLVKNIYNGLATWWHGKMDRLDNFCAEMECRRTLMEETEQIPPKSKYDPNTIKLGLQRVVCVSRGKVVAIQKSNGYQKLVLGFRDFATTKIVTVREFIEKHLADEIMALRQKTNQRAAEASSTCPNENNPQTATSLLPEIKVNEPQVIQLKPIASENISIENVLTSGHTGLQQQVFPDENLDNTIVEKDNTSSHPTPPKMETFEKAFAEKAIKEVIEGDNSSSLDKSEIGTETTTTTSIENKQFFPGKETETTIEKPNEKAKP